MKNFLMLGAMVISATIFAADPATNPHAAHQNAGQNGMMMGSMMTPEMMQKMKDSGMSCPMMEAGGMQNNGMMGGNMMANMTPEQKVAMEKDMAVMQEKMAEVKKLTSVEKPDWKKVEKLNEEIAKLRAKHMTEMMKSGHTMMMQKPVSPKAN